MIGEAISHYRILSKLGAGGMGEVYLAEDTQLHRKVALKILPADLASNQDRMRRFEQEAKSAAALNHPNIAHIYEIGESDVRGSTPTVKEGSIHFIAMEFIDGVTLREKIHQERTELSKLLRFLQHAAEGLAKAHAAGIVHRDLKPDNIMITRDGHAKILDFGLAKLIEQQSMTGGDSSEVATALMPQHSTPGTVMGTVGYMSPEQAQGKTNEIDQRSDIFSFGCILYEAVTGKKPFEGDSVVKSLHMVIYESAPPLAELNPSAPADLQRIVRRCLAKDPEDRYQTIKEVAIELKELRRELQGAGIDTTVAPPGRSKTSTSTGGEATSSLSLSPITDRASLSARASSAEYVVAGIKQHKLAVAVSLLVLVAGLTAVTLYRRGRNSGAVINSIAVMPFVNESKNEEVEFLSDGMTETLISSLSKIPNLSVKARSTVFYYKGKETSTKKIGEELTVQAVLWGRVTQRGDDLKLSLELVNTGTQDVIWSETYNRKQSDLVTLQADIARDVSSKLKFRLSSAESASVEKNYTSDSEAYQLYLQGRFHWNRRTSADFQQAVVFFKKAIEKDPNYALAYAGLADTYALFPDWVNGRPKEYMPQAKQAALKALELDPKLAEAHASLALITFYYDYDLAGAEQSFKRSIELNPKYPSARQWYGGLLIAAGRLDEGLRETSKAAELDPFSKIIIWNLGDAFQFNGRYDEAIRQYQKFIELFSDQRVNGDIGNTYAAQGKYQQAVEAYLNGYRSAKEIKPEEIQRLKESFEKGGWESFGRAKQEIDLGLRRARQAKDPNGYVKPYEIATAYCWGKDKDKVMEYLNKAYEERSADVFRLRTDFTFAVMRDDPRFKELIKKVGIPE